ncbi:MAG: HAD hydrolase-like protein [Marinifilaceae bacterium]|jgi:phosphoglycolate phosphatase-like HAD superfamily hydrolase|nr:HAD hydrolase-like protein [Marinifilaceae bacterium]
MFDIREYKNIVLDCDGVILDSNEIKTKAFYEIAAEYSENIAKQFVEYHKKAGGVSRFKKIRMLFEELLERPDEDLIQKAIEKYSTIVKRNLIACNYVDGFEEFIENCPKSTKLFVASGGFEDELKEVFKQRGIDHKFEKICGSPRDKYQIIDNLKLSRKEKILFVGDSKLDYEVANHYNFDFIFLYGYTEFGDCFRFFRDKQVIIRKNWAELLNL